MNVITKWLIVIATITALITGTAKYFNNRVKNVSDTLFFHMDKIREHVLKEEWEKAAEEFEYVENDWNKKKNLWMMTINHNEVDAISLSMAKLKGFIATREKAHAFSELAFLKQLVNNVVDNRRFSLSNML